MTTSPADPDAPKLNQSDVVGVCGDILDWKVKAIIETGASLAELEAACAWAVGADEVLGEEREPLSGTTAAVYEVLLANEQFDDEPPRT